MKTARRDTALPLGKTDLGKAGLEKTGPSTPKAKAEVKDAKSKRPLETFSDAKAADKTALSVPLTSSGANETGKAQQSRSGSLGFGVVEVSPELQSELALMNVPLDQVRALPDNGLELTGKVGTLAERFMLARALAGHAAGDVQFSEHGVNFTQQGLTTRVADGTPPTKAFDAALLLLGQLPELREVALPVTGLFLDRDGLRLHGPAMRLPFGDALLAKMKEAATTFGRDVRLSGQDPTSTSGVMRLADQTYVPNAS